MPRPLLIAAALSLAAAGPRPAEAGEHGLAARVNGAGITRERLERYFEERLEENGRHVAAIRSPGAFKALKREALEELVDRELLWQEAEQRRHVVSRDDVDAAMAMFREQLPDPARRRLALERGGFTEETYAEYVRRELSIRRLIERELAPRVQVTAADVRAFHEANPDRFSAPPGVVLTEAEVRDAIRAHLRDEGMKEAVAARLAELREKARVEILIPLEGT